MYMYMYVVYSLAGKVQRSPSIIVLYVYVINSLNEILDDIKVSIPGIRNQYSVNISLNCSVAIMTTFSYGNVHIVYCTCTEMVGL